MEKKMKKATALKYDPATGDSAPMVITSGIGKLAERILEIAMENEIPIHHDSDLAEVLSKLDIGSEIPEELFTAVAEILTFLYNSGKKKMDF